MAETAYSHVAILGAGAWGTALAATAARAGRRVTLWGRDGALLVDITAGENPKYLPGVELPEDISVTTALPVAAGGEAIILAAPAQATRALLADLVPLLTRATPLVIAAKGIEQGSGSLMTELVAEVAPGHPVAMLSGPSFAREVAMGLPTAITIAGPAPIAGRLQATLSTPSFRPYTSDDIAGVALGGAAKNVYAIACGVVDGMILGENARAALLARGFAELARLGEMLGARRETLMGLSGFGDLVLTATSDASRNFAAGVELGRGKSAAVIAAPGHPLAEGLATAPALVARAKAVGVELPIAEAMADLITGALPLSEAVARLMSRKLTTE
ncbi:MAG: NAD(P)-dependent glycerol-3-phosphate dehydrogenase [Alphaproteobacteria bacterium]|nr:NAD(P)-dependent glycerol-3-phosphate dehydrogenase [Alphaproteobacteria bacterium]